MGTVHRVSEWLPDFDEERDKYVGIDQVSAVWTSKFIVNAEIVGRVYPTEKPIAVSMKWEQAMLTSLSDFLCLPGS